MRQLAILSVSHSVQLLGEVAEELDAFILCPYSEIWEVTVSFLFKAVIL